MTGTKRDLAEAFIRIFGGEEKECRYVFSPGRVNLIGEHVDYNGGRVFPCALTIGTYFVGRLRKDDRMRFYSGNFPGNGIYEWTLPITEPDKGKGFSNYPAGMVNAFMRLFRVTFPCGMDVYMWGNIPNSSGLSSSASVEVGMGKLLCLLYALPFSNEEIAKAAQDSENVFNGVNCGIMDQFAVAMGKENQAIYLDTATLEREYVPVRLDGISLVIICTNKKRGLADSKYNERRSECEEALQSLRTALSVRNLCDLSSEEFDAAKQLIRNDVVIARARHAITENERTKEAVQALQKGDIARFGQLMNESHKSLKEDYEVTGPELDTIAEESMKIPGVLGARMTGAGFGGCAVALVKTEVVEEYKKILGKKYREAIGYDADFFEVQIGNGTYEM